MSTAKPVSGMMEFFESGKALPVFEPGKAPVYGTKLYAGPFSTYF